jgi:hypothetical protein
VPLARGASGYSYRAGARLMLRVPDYAPPALSIIDAMDDPLLFQPWFPGDTWNNWRAILKGIYALPMTADEVGFFRSVADRDPPKKAVREVWLICGRGAGKDAIASAITAHSAALFDGSSYLRPGERALVMCLATDREQSKICLNYVRSYFTDVELFKGMIQRETATGFELSNGVDIAVATNSYRSVRGRSILCCIFDECAFWRDETSQTPDEETFRAVRPALARVPGSIMIGISSPYKKSGLLYRKFKAHYGNEDSDVLVIRAPSTTLNPTIDQAEIDKDLTEDPASARAEYFAEWRDDIGGWLDMATIEAAVDFGVTVRPPVANNKFRYRSGVDPSGGGKDSYVLAIAHDEAGLAILDCVVEIRGPSNPATATETIAATLKEYGLRDTVGDKYAAGWVVDAFAKCGIKYGHSERVRSEIYLDVLPLFTSGKVRLLDNPRLVNQFASLERRTLSGGKDIVDHGKGGHDDVCNAAALALITRGRQPMTINPALVAATRRRGPCYF